MKIESWDDLKFILAVSKAGTLTQASHALCVDQTTVTRRLKALEELAGVRLFDRLRGGVELTPAGEAVAKAAQDIEDTILSVERVLSAEEPEIAGLLRFTTSELLAFGWIDKFTEFARRHPRIELDISGTNEVRSISRREADVALRLTSAPPEDLIGRRLGKAAYAVYGAASYALADLRDVPWIGWDSADSSPSIVGQYRKEIGCERPYALRVNSYLLLIEAVRRGTGVTILPCITGERAPDLVCLGDPVIMSADLWLLTHPDLKRSPRVRALMDFVVGLVEADQKLLMGETS
jgi:DNA-binding transcriptional LysR family regulator